MGVVIDVNSVGGFLAIGGAMVGAVIWICKSMFGPLKESFDKLIQTIEKLEKAINAEHDERHALEIKVQAIDDRYRSLQHRVDKLETERN